MFFRPFWSFYLLNIEDDDANARCTDVCSKHSVSMATQNYQSALSGKRLFWFGKDSLWHGTAILTLIFQAQHATFVWQHQYVTRRVIHCFDERYQTPKEIRSFRCYNRWRQFLFRLRQLLENREASDQLIPFSDALTIQKLTVNRTLDMKQYFMMTPMIFSMLYMKLHRWKLWERRNLVIMLLWKRFASPATSTRI